MSFLNSLFGGKKSIGAVLVNTRTNIFKLYGVSYPTDAQKMKASVYLCIAGIAILNDLGRGASKPIIDKLVEEAKSITKPLSMPVRELANSKEELKKILADFPQAAQVNEATIINGLAAFEALYFTRAEVLIRNILSHKQGPLGTPGYASIVVVDETLGEGKSKEHFMECSMELMNFAKKLVEAF